MSLWLGVFELVEKFGYNIDIKEDIGCITLRDKDNNRVARNDKCPIQIRLRQLCNVLTTDELSCIIKQYNRNRKLEQLLNDTTRER